MVDRESGRGSGHSAGDGSIHNSYDEPVGISKKVIVYLVIVALIAVLGVVYVMQLRRGRGAGSGSAGKSRALHRNRISAATESVCRLRSGWAIRQRAAYEAAGCT